MKVLSTEGLTKLIELIKGSFVSVTDTVSTTTVTLATVATSGSYNDLSDKPTIPPAATVNDSNMVIQRNGTSVGTFTANQSAASTINISVPTTASDVSALPDSTVIGSAFLTIKRNGTAIGSFGANSTIPVDIDITVPDSLTVDTVMSTTSTNPVQNKVISSAIESKTVATFTNVSAGTSATVSNLIINKVTSAEYATITPSDTELYFITDDSGITSTDITNALGYTPYNSSNPSGYITSSAITNMQTTTNLVTTLTTASTDATYPSAKCVYDLVGNIETLINAL